MAVPKIIKKAGKWLWRVFYVLVILLVTAYFLLQTETVQTYLCQKAASYLAGELETKVEIKHVNIEFVKKIVLEGIYIEDKHKDTLLYVSELKVDIDNFDYSLQQMFVSDISLKDGKSEIIYYKSDSDLSFQFIKDYFRDTDTTKKDTSAGWNIEFGDIKLINFEFCYRDDRFNDTSRGIDFEDMRVKQINANFSGLKTIDDTITVHIKDFSGKEKSGFEIKKMTAHATFSPVFTKLDSLDLLANESELKTNLLFKYKEYDDYDDFIHKVKMVMHFDKVKVQMNDIGYFAPELKGLNRIIYLSGDVSGRVDDLKGKNMDIAFGENTFFKGDFQMSGLPNIDETYLNFNIVALSTTKKDIEEIPLPPYDKPTFIKLSDNMGLLGKVTYKGKIDGYYYSLVSNGTFNTALGVLATDIHVDQNTDNGEISYKGRLRTNNFDIGKLTYNEKTVGKITMDAQLNGTGVKISTLRANLERCDIASLDFNGYTYSNISAKGNLAKKIFNGELDIDDENVVLSFSGDVNFSKSPTTMNFISRIDKMKLVPLNFVKSENKISFGTNMEVHLTGDKIDDIVGNITLTNLAYFQGKQIYEAETVKLTSENNSGIKKISLTSDFADGWIQGKFTTEDIAAAFQKTIEYYLPSLKEKEERKPKKETKLTEQKFNYDISLKDTKGITDIFFPNIAVESGTKIEGKYDSQKNDLVIKGGSPKITVSGTEMKGLSIDAFSENSKFKFQTNCLRYILADTVWADKVLIESTTYNDTIHFDLSWNNAGAKKNQGDFKAFLSFTDSPQIKLKFISSALFIADSSWTIGKANEIRFDTSFVMVKDFLLRNKKQTLNISGIISENPADKLYIQMEEFNLGNINIITNSYGLNFKGFVSGNSDIANIYKPENLIYSANLDFKDFKINSEDIGSGSVVSIYDKKKDAISLNGTFSKGTIPNFEFSGYYYPNKEKDNIDIEATIKNFKLVFFEPYIKDVCETFRGLVDAEIKVKGEISKPQISGFADLKVKNVHMNYLNTNYSLTDAKIIIEPNSFGVENLIVNDINGNTAIVTGKAYHDNFKNFQLDFDIKANKFLCLSTTEKDNNLYYGTAFASGVINFSGFVDDVIRIDAAIKTDKAYAIDPKTGIKKLRYTQFNIPLSGTSEVSDNDFITFVKKDTSVAKINKEYKVNLSGILLNLELEATPDAEVQLIFDEKIGDVIRATGKGNILMSINTNGNFSMYGEYELEDGDYLFTLQNVINKKFRIEKGSTVKWSGDPYNAIADIRAVYEVRTSLKPFFPNDSSSKYAKRYPVDCILNMKGNLLNPEITFDVDLPTVDSQDKEEVLKYLKTEQEMNKQIFALLVLNSFIAPSQDNVQNSYVGQAINSTSSDLLSNQLSNWLSQISNDFDIGVHYRPGDYLTKDEVELALSTQLFNDKLSIDGSVSNNTSTNSQNANNVVGDVSAEYKITDDGKVRIKAFNKANENTVVNTDAAYTQGVGVFYREEFDTISELYRRYLSMMKKKDDSKPKP